MDKLKKIINSGEYESIKGWCPKEKALKMASLVKPNDVCIELGVYGGRSLLPLCLMTKNKVFGVDAWSKNASLDGENKKENDDWWSNVNYYEMYNYTINLMKKHNCINCSLLRMTSEEAIGHFFDNSIDLIHQDSNHSEQISCLEVELYENKLKPGGFWVFDDTDWDTTKKAQERLIEKNFVLINDYGNWKIFQKPV